MLQRNTSGSPLIVMTDPPVTVAQGDEIEHPVLLGGFEPIDIPMPAVPVKAVSAQRINRDGDDLATAEEA